MAEWFHPTVGVRQGCLLSPTLFDIFLEKILMTLTAWQAVSKNLTALGYWTKIINEIRMENYECRENQLMASSNVPITANINHIH